MIKSVSMAALAALCVNLAAHADTDDDELVRLPGQGEVRDQALRERTKADRLKPGAGLFITFDLDGNGRISADEMDTGIPAAFQNADANQDGYLTALEQRDWAGSLPTRDDSLANPFRFDPNLDRRVDLNEFTMVIVNLGQDYANEESGEIVVSELKAPKPKARDRRDEAQDGARPPRGERPGDRRNQTLRSW